MKIWGKWARRNLQKKIPRNVSRNLDDTLALDPAISCHFSCRAMSVYSTRHEVGFKWDYTYIYQKYQKKKGNHYRTYQVKLPPPLIKNDFWDFWIWRVKLPSLNLRRRRKFLTVHDGYLSTFCQFNTRQRQSLCQFRRLDPPILAFFCQISADITVSVLGLNFTRLYS